MFCQPSNSLKSDLASQVRLPQNLALFYRDRKIWKTKRGYMILTLVNKLAFEVSGKRLTEQKRKFEYTPFFDIALKAT